MPARLTLHPPQRASRFLIVRDAETLLIGRDADCGLVLEDQRISKQHALLSWSGPGWSLRDLESKNGTWINGSPAAGQRLQSGDWISFGGVVGRFELISEQETGAAANDRLARLHTSIQLRRRLGEGVDPFDLLLRFLESAMEVTAAERGFVLVRGSDGAMRVEVASGFSMDDLRAESFGGSMGALALALSSGSAVVVADVQKDAYLGGRRSVVAMGLRAVACVPIRQDGELAGALYVDGQKPASFSELDVEILESLAEHTGIAIASLRLDRRLQELMRVPGGEGDVIGLLQERVARAVPPPGAASAI